MNKRNDKNRRSSIKKGLLFATVAFIAIPSCGKEPRQLLPTKPESIEYITVAALQDRFFGWPANNGLWQWDNGREILVGFTNGNFEDQDGHNIGKEQLTNLARSTDGGKTWEREDPYILNNVSVLTTPILHCAWQLEAIMEPRTRMVAFSSHTPGVKNGKVHTGLMT